MNVAVFGTRNEDNLNRIYRLCAHFGVSTLAIVASRARVRGNLFSAKGQVALEYLTTVADFLGRGYTPVIVGAVAGGHLPSPAVGPLDRAVVCVGSEIAPVPPEVRKVAQIVWTIPRFGKAPPLTADQALAIMLWELAGSSWPSKR